ncbi:hypothetical protein ACFQ3N_14505 [Virgibacillus byunsanensis]|uniref:Uncharacterized protein n=1 Tax=Virgibacillus byunsanensis TaxID=570945 RepID=A0ABW3LNI6_9BACI
MAEVGEKHGKVGSTAMAIFSMINNNNKVMLPYRLWGELAFIV